MALVAYGFILILIAASATILIATVIRGAPFMGTKREAVGRMVALAGLRVGERMIDLGAGDGRIIIEFAKAGVEAHGYEINPFLVWYARRNIRRAGLQKRAFMHWKSLWKADLSSARAVTVFGIRYIMPTLEKKLRAELPRGARAVSYVFQFPAWEPVKQEGKLFVYEA